jgi:hypothetical protein
MGLIPQELLNRLGHMDTAVTTMAAMADDMKDIKNLLQQLIDIETARDAVTGRIRPRPGQREKRAG